MSARHDIRYTITPVDPAAHLFEVTLEADAPESGMQFVLPAWIPGSYMVREFARNIVWLKAEVDGAQVEIEKADKHTWRLGRVSAGAKAVRLHYAVYAWDLSVRCAHLDQNHGFFNGTQVFLRAVGRETLAHRVRIDAPAGVRDWTVATTLPEASGRGAAKRRGFGWYVAADYDTLIDHPVEMGRLTWASFDVRGVPHDFAINGRHDCDLARLTADLEKACEAQCAVFGDAPPPFGRYLFMLTVVGDGYGGLEHRDSTALLASRSDLPFVGMKETTEAYRGFLGLCSHEYFHAWNVKRIKPAAFAPYDLQQENYTRLLWLFEGFTSYYDDLALVRAGLISRDEYLGLLAKTMSAVQRGAGRTLQSVADSSFDAWIKYYRQDENAPNAIVSYYAKGSLVALALDLALRGKSGGEKSLDDVMRLLWLRYGDGSGVPETALPAVIREATGIDLARLLRQATEGCDDLPLGKLLKSAGVTLTWESDGELPSIGAKLASEGESVKLAQVFHGGPVHAAGLSAGDLLIALDGLRVKAGGLDARLARLSAGATVSVHAFRRDELFETRVQLAPAAPVKAKLVEDKRAAKPAAALRERWIGRR